MEKLHYLVFDGTSYMVGLKEDLKDDYKVIDTYLDMYEAFDDAKLLNDEL